MIRTLGISTLGISALGFAGAALAADPPHTHEEAKIEEAVVVLVPKAGSGKVNGVLTLKQEKNDVHVTGEVTGLSPGKHGFHIHMYGDTRSADGLSTGGHYNPHNKPHGKPDSKERHEGDLGNIEANAQGVAKVDAVAHETQLHHLIGRAIVVHQDPDDFSQPVGNAGPRVAVGVIGLAAPPMKK